MNQTNNLFTHAPLFAIMVIGTLAWVLWDIFRNKPL